MFTPLLILIVSFYGLVKSSDYLISTSSILGSRIGISKIIIGLTLVAIGTSLPELVSVIFGLTTSTAGGDFFTGTIIGSNIANSLLILSVLLYFTHQKLSSINPRENWFLILATLCFILMLLFNQISIFSGILFLCFFATYMYMTIFATQKKDLEDETDEFENQKLNKKSSFFLTILFIFAMIGLNISARGVVYSIDSLAILLQIPQFLLTFTTIALATSLPELVVTIRASQDNQTDIAFGDIIGSNITNILLIGGVGSMLVEFLNVTIRVSQISLLFLILATTLVLLSSKYLPKKHYKKAGIIIFCIYLGIIGTILLI